MGLNPTALYKTFTFDGSTSASYGVFLTGEGVFNSPERSVEMIEIPGRNGDYAMDKGRFQNIELVYKAALVDYTESDFADRISNVRNWLASKIGYKRLSDDYNPDEYRMALFSGGVEVEHFDLKTGEFDIIFNCKPQRWLTSGETATAVANNGTLSNPTLFDSEPLLAVKGYGTIGFNGYEIEIENGDFGDITLYDGGANNSIVLDESNLNIGDTITVNGSEHIVSFKSEDDKIQYKSQFVTNTISCTNSDFSLNHVSIIYEGSARYRIRVSIALPTFNITVGTDSTVTNTVSGTISTQDYHSNTVTFTIGFTETFTYTASTHTLSFSVSGVSISCSSASIRATVLANGNANYNNIVGHSTKSKLGNPTYIDCDIGECYMINTDNEIVSLNQYIDLGSDLPKLSSGTNTFTYDNTVTELKVTPRWWKV